MKLTSKQLIERAWKEYERGVKAEAIMLLNKLEEARDRLLEEKKIIYLKGGKK